VVFIDSNIPMYLVGDSHPNQLLARRTLELLLHEETRLVSDVEVLQEILHRYAAIGRLDAIQPAFDALHSLVDEVFAIDRQDLERAKAVLLGSAGLSARDAIHVATMDRHQITTILSFDQGFDKVPGVRRLPRAGLS